MSKAVSDENVSSGVNVSPDSKQRESENTAATPSSPERLVVLGGGPAGIAAAYFGLQAGYKVTLLEKTPIPGGKGASRSVGPFIIDFGPHAFHPKAGAVTDLVRKHAGDDYLLGPVRMELILKEKRLRYPFSPFEGLRKFNPFFSLRLVADYAYTRVVDFASPLPDDTFKAWGVKHFGRSLYDLCFGKYTERVWGLNADELSAELARRKLPRFSLWGLLTEGILKRNKMNAHIFTTDFAYHRRGIGKIYEAICEEIRRLGGEVVYNATVESFERDDSGAIRNVRIGGLLPRSFPCNHVISSIPLTKLHAALYPGSQRQGRVAFRDIFLLYLMLKRPQFSPAHWIYLVDERFNFHRISEQKNLSADCCPPNETVLTLEISAKDFQGSEDALIDGLTERALEDLAYFGISKSEIKQSMLTRLEDAYPIYYKGYREELAAILDDLSNVPNLISTGRQGLYLDIDMHDAMVLGKDAVAALGVADPKTYYTAKVK